MSIEYGGRPSSTQVTLFHYTLDASKSEWHLHEVLFAHKKYELAATLRWFTAGGAIRIALRQLSQTRKLRHYDVLNNVITQKL